MKTLTAVLLALELMITAAAAQVAIDKRRPASRSGTVSIENSFGSIKVIGWDKEEVTVTGTLAAGAEGIDLSGDKQEVSIDVQNPEAWMYGTGDDTEYRTNIEIHAPKGSSLEIRTVNAVIGVEGIDGEMEIESVNGAVTVAGNPRSVEVRNVTGGVDVSAAGASMRVESVSGAVSLRGAAKQVQIESVSGGIQVSGRDIESAEIKTTSGDVRFEGTLKREGGVEIETFSGKATLVLPPDVAAKFHLITFSGQIANDIGPKPARSERSNPYQELRFSTGLDDYDVSVKTYSGNIELKLSRGGPGAGAPTKGGADRKGTE